MFFQNVFGQCLGRFGALAPAAATEPLAGIAPFGAAIAPFGAAAGFGTFGYDLAYPGVAGIAASYDVIAPYGGVGEGNVAVAGELPVVGTTAVAGQVPIMGAVRFGGDVAAAGAVSITGSCACGCGAPYLY